MYIAIKYAMELLTSRTEIVVFLLQRRRMIQRKHKTGHHHSMEANQASSLYERSVYSVTLYCGLEDSICDVSALNTIVLRM